eukprot:gene10727-biopygen18328
MKPPSRFNEVFASAHLAEKGKCGGKWAPQAPPQKKLRALCVSHAGCAAAARRRAVARLWGVGGQAARRGVGGGGVRFFQIPRAEQEFHGLFVFLAAMRTAARALQARKMIRMSAGSSLAFQRVYRDSIQTVLSAREKRLRTRPGRVSSNYIAWDASAAVSPRNIRLAPSVARGKEGEKHAAPQTPPRGGNVGNEKKTVC